MSPVIDQSEEDVGPDVQDGRARWHRLETLFFSAAALPHSQRSLFLDDQCGNDAVLRREAESLLAMDATGACDILAVIEGAASSLFREEPMEGALFGTWRVVREIGRGGMGAVYLAVRDGADFEKQVAIKLVKRGIDTAAVLSRFLDERRILAGLDHPYIARLIDGDTSPDGRPYFIMEFVQGVSITEYCVRENLTAHQRCELFRKVCEPVSYAHGRLVIHRDLKPANILIMPGGSPKLLDFGIARLLNAVPKEDHPGIPHLTHALTPQYASPEQTRGEPVDTATDVYSLGVILRELVSDRYVPEDLASVIAMATRPDAATRYSSVEQFSEDVRRYLNGLPVQAQEDSWMYRTRRFVGRNRLSVAAGILAAFLLTAGIVSIAWESRQANIQRGKAEQRLGQMVELANRALFDVHSSIERLPGATQARRKIVKSTVDYLDKLRAESGDDPRVLSTLASAYQQVARIEGSPLEPNLGDSRSAQDSFLKAQKIMATLLTRDPHNIELRLRAAALNSDMGELIYQSGKDQEALSIYRKGLEHVAVARSAEPGNFNARKLESQVRLRMNAVTLSDAPVAARQADLARLPFNEALVREHPEDIDCLLNLATTWSQIAASYFHEGRLAEQASSYRKVAELRERAFAMRPDDVTVQRDLLIAYGHVGDTLGSPFMVSQGDYPGAIESYTKAATLARRMSVADPSDKRARMDLGVALMRIGAAQTAYGKYPEGLHNLEVSRSILDSFVAEPLVSLPMARQAALLYEYRARALQSLGQPADAIASWRRSLDLCRKVLDVTPDTSCQKQRIVDWNGLAPLLASTDDSAVALKTILSSLDSSRQIANGSMLSEKAYWPRALAANGAVYIAFAKRSQIAADESFSNWRAAADSYRRAVTEWRNLQPLAWPFSNEARLASQHLAECERALHRPF